MTLSELTIHRVKTLRAIREGRRYISKPARKPMPGSPDIVARVMDMIEETGGARLVRVAGKLAVTKPDKTYPKVPIATYDRNARREWVKEDVREAMDKFTQVEAA